MTVIPFWLLSGGAGFVGALVVGGVLLKISDQQTLRWTFLTALAIGIGIAFLEGVFNM